LPTFYTLYKVNTTEVLEKIRFNVPKSNNSTLTQLIMLILLDEKYLYTYLKLYVRILDNRYNCHIIYKRKKKKLYGLKFMSNYI
jgi:hypothetical protein